MTLHWLICSSLMLSASAAEIAGEVTLRDSHIPAVRRAADYSGVVISLHPIPDTAEMLSTDRHAKMVQKNKTFAPHVLPVQVGTTVDFPNFDPIFHNAFSSYSGQIFDVGLYPPGSSRGVRFSRPGIVRVFCNIHSSMSATIVVLNTPYFSVTSPDGHYALEAPPGRYELRVFHERASGAALRLLYRTIVIGTERNVVPPIAVSEAGYLQAPHNNKFGHPYPQESGDRNGYPAVK